MSASSSLFLAVALACLVISANTLKCWNGSDVAQQMPKNQMECEPGNFFCAKVHCQDKNYQIPFTIMICQHDSSLCDQGYLEDQYSICEKIQCCSDDYCNYMPDRVIPKPPIVIISGMIGLHTSLGIGYIVFAALITVIFSAFVKWF